MWQHPALGHGARFVVLAVTYMVVVVSWLVGVKKLDCEVGLVKLRVKYGDICKERCDAIVNSTNAKLDLSVGTYVPCFSSLFAVLLTFSLS